MWVGWAGYAGFAAIGLHYAVYLPYVKGEQPEYDDAQGVPVAVGCLVVGGTAMTIAVWPVWGFLTPVIGFVIFMGLVNVTSLLP